MEYNKSMLKSFSYRLYPTAEQQRLLTRTFGSVRFVLQQASGVQEKGIREKEGKPELLRLQCLLNETQGHPPLAEGCQLPIITDGEQKPGHCVQKLFQ